MPQYVGSVRVMVIGANVNRYASVEKTVKVKSPLMIISSMPRTLKTNDEFDITVSLISGLEEEQVVALNIESEGPLALMEEPLNAMTLGPEEEKVFRIRVKADNEIGIGTIKIIAKSDTKTTVHKIPLEVKLPAPHVSKLIKQIDKPIKRGDKIDWILPKAFIAGSDKAFVTISKLPKLSLKRHLNTLIKYPYGCIEQTTSAVLPQLYLNNLLSFSINDNYF